MITVRVCTILSSWDLVEIWAQGKRVNSKFILRIPPQVVMRLRTNLAYQWEAYSTLRRNWKMVTGCLLIVLGSVDENLFHLQGKTECWLQCAKNDDQHHLRTLQMNLHHGLIREACLKWNIERNLIRCHYICYREPLKIGAWFHRQEVEMGIYRIIIKVLNIFQVSDEIKVL